MQEDSAETNPFASPSLRAEKSEKDLPDDLAAERKEVNMNSARWTGICFLVGCALFIVGAALFNAGGRTIGACVVAASLVVLFAGPLLWYLIGTTSSGR